jgi:hypothetical protein
VADAGRGNAWGQPEGMLEALRDFREAAETATLAWGQDITVQQGLDIAWMLGTVIRDFRIATERLSQYKVTVDPGDGADTPDQEIRKASRNLDAARELARTGEAAVKAAARSNLARGAYPGGGPDAGNPAVAAVHAMVSALGVSDGAWRAPAGTREARYEVVTGMMRAMDAFGTAVLTLAEGAPAPFQESLLKVAVAFDRSIGHLREALIISVTANYQPGTEWIADAVRAAYPLRFTHEPTGPAPGSQAAPGDPPAAALAGEGFPVMPGDPPMGLPPAEPDGPGSTVGVRRPAAGCPGPSRKGL